MEADAKDWDDKTTYHWLVSAVAPRPVAWVTTMDAETGTVNLAPFSWFQTVCAAPPTIVIAFGDKVAPGEDGARTVAKDTLRNIEATGQFVVNVATVEAADAVVQSSADYPPDVSEVDAVGLATTPSRRVAPPRLAQAPAHMECRLVETKRIGGQGGSTLVIGEVVHFAARDEVLDARGNLDPEKVMFLARMGGRHYTGTQPFFSMDRPTR